ncbi:hypothetical protein [Paramicrobacterium humi]|uniref:hypothetical protein n=1 Tax=Paramicrobacterium humi TaxID=640635 RepID=UPI000B80473A|nr:hypothetical protein [Microbacterium humi]
MHDALRELITEFINNGSDPRSAVFAANEYAFHTGAYLEGGERVREWIRRVNDLDAFLAGHGRLPRERGEHTSAAEAALAGWVRYQRRAATRAQHCVYQQRRLELVPGFSWDPRRDAQLAHERDYLEFFTGHGQAPSYRSAEAGERRLADWAAKRRMAARRGDLSAEEVERLRRVGITAPRRK